ncbi:MAG: acylneuraminate cytidylyltransferase family protein [Colwellia sp.]
METLTIIPAKGASTRLARKNILSLQGKSLVQHAYDAALESSVCGDIMVSTEDAEIAEHAKQLGAWLPFLRPINLSMDPSGVESVALYCLSELEKLGYQYKKLILLLPTCPLRNSDDIKAANKIFNEHKVSRLMSVCEYDHSPYSSWVNKNGQVKPLFDQHYQKKSQQLEMTYRCNGAIHILDIEEFKLTRSYTMQPLYSYVMPRERSVDIDTQDDWRYAEWLMSKNCNTELA